MTPSSPAGSPLTPDATPSFEDILRYLSGAAQLMAGRPEGLKKLDLSADGFWTSFSSILVALPALALSWVEFEMVARPEEVAGTSAAAAYAAHAVADVLGWVLPVLILMSVAKWIGFSRKIVPLVVATNWGGVLIVWAAVPYWLLTIVAGESDLTAALGVLVSLASIVLTARLTATALGGDVMAALGVVALMIVTSLVTYGAIMDLTGIALV